MILSVSEKEKKNLVIKLISGLEYEEEEYENVGLKEEEAWEKGTDKRK